MVSVAVIGVGAMGRNHARVYAELSDVQLVGVADVNQESAVAVANQFGGQAYCNYIELLDSQKPDAVTIAVPTIDHLTVALAVIERGIHLLIEKPIAFSVAEGEQIIQAAADRGVKLMVGHIERFNPAVVALKKHLAEGDLGRVFQIEARRQGPFPARIKDVGVVIDLAVHDLDVMRYISQKEVKRIYAETERRIHSTYEDSVCGLIRFQDGIIGTLTINWLTPTKIRELIVTGERGMFRVDYLTQDLYFFENATAEANSWEHLQVLRGVSEGKMIRCAVAKKEPLRAELEAFMAAVQDKEPISITGADGLEALFLAKALAEAGLNNQIIEI